MKFFSRRLFLILFFFVVIILLWNDLIKEEAGELEYDYAPRVKISALPTEIFESLAAMTEQAEELKVKNSYSLEIPFLKKEEIKAGTPLVLQTYYLGSNKLEEKVAVMPDSFVGLSLKQLASIKGNWQLKDYSSRALILYRTVNDLAPEDKKYLHLGVKEGKVAIFYGRAGMEYLKEVTEIRLEDLPLQLQKDLEEGIEVESAEELLALLEGLASSVNQD